LVPVVALIVSNSAVAGALFSRADYLQTGAAHPFFSRTDYLRTELGVAENPALADEASALSINPAGLALRNSSTFFFSRSFGDDVQHTNILMAENGFGFGWQRTSIDGAGRVDRWRLAGASGDASGIFGVGVGVSWTKPRGLGEGSHFSADVGAVCRPSRYVSLGVVGRQLDGERGYPWSVEAGLALRPTGNEMLTVFGGFAIEEEALDDTRLSWHVGGAMNITNTVEIGVARNSRGAMLARASLVFGHATAGASGYRSTGNGSPNWAIVRAHRNRRQTLLQMRGNVAELRLRGTVRDRGTSSLFGAPTVPLSGLIAEIDRAANARDVGALYIRLEGLSIGQGMAEELREALLRFKDKSGRPVVCYMQSCDVRGYLIALAADSIFMEQMGYLNVVGYAASSLLLRRALDKLGIQPEFVRVGKYKSATEMFTDSTMSDANREQIGELLDDWYAYLIDAVALSRGIATDSAATLVDNGPYTASDAKERGMISEIGREERAYRSAKSLAGGDGKRLSMAGRRRYDERWGPRPRVAVVFATGQIVTGAGGVDMFTGESFIGSETMVKALKSVREDESIDAVVLRIDSPGGFALAGDMIWAELNEIRESDKPLVVSVGDLCASGGYQLACASDSIISNSGSIVGSIGIFSGKLSLHGLYDKLGVDTDVITRGRNAAIFSTDTLLTPEQRDLLQRHVDQGYQTFVDRVAAGRDMTSAEVDSVGRGRIWSGERGIDMGLVDRTGGLNEAIETAMRMADIEGETWIVPYPKQLSLWEVLLRERPTGSFSWLGSEGSWYYDPTAEALR